MEAYLSLLREVLQDGVPKGDRTGTGTISKFGVHRTYDLQRGFPLVTTKKMYFKAVVAELIWFIAGDSNIKFLVDHNVRIWNEWPFARFQASPAYDGRSLEEFVAQIKTDAAFAQKWGDLGPVYGRQWRNFNGEGFDQLRDLVAEIKANPNSRRLILTAWNPPQVHLMALPPCHTLAQFYVANGELSCQLYQRSGDLFLGVPFNIASYALLTHMLAQVTGLQVGKLIHTIGDAHIYRNHMPQVEAQLARAPQPLPRIVLNPQVTSLFDFTLDDIGLENYAPLSPIKAAVAV